VLKARIYKELKATNRVTISYAVTRFRGRMECLWV